MLQNLASAAVVIGALRVKKILKYIPVFVLHNRFELLLLYYRNVSRDADSYPPLICV